MAARAIASSTISFGLVSIPRKLYSTGDSGPSISLNFMHEDRGTRIKQQHICSKCDVIVPRDDMTKGNELAKGGYVLFGEEEIMAVEIPREDAVEITECVPADQVEAVHLDKPYYLGPAKGSARAYRLPSTALSDSNRAAIARYATRGKEYLVMIRPPDEGLVLDQFRYAQDVHCLDETEVKEAEPAHAQQLIDRKAASGEDADVRKPASKAPRRRPPPAERWPSHPNHTAE